jgi:DNA-directed RNA polymerase subunit L
MIIYMEKISSIDYKVIKYDKNLPDNILEVKIKGKSIDYVVVSTLRRSILTYVPIFAFTKFNFTTNESIFNNNYLKLRLSNMPVLGITNNIDKHINNKKNNLEVIEEEMNEMAVEDDIDLTATNVVNSSTLNQLTMYVDYKSTSKGTVAVTTDDAKFYNGEKSISSPYKIPIPIVKLKPNQSITFSAITTLGIERESSIYSPVSVCYYKEINENEFNFVLESRGQLKENRIIEVAIINIIRVIERLSDLIPTEELNDENEGQIIIPNENHTIGNLISHGMQKHKNVDFAGYNMPHLLEEKVIIHYKLTNNKVKIKNVLDDVIIYYIELFKDIMKLNSKIN